MKCRWWCSQVANAFSTSCAGIFWSAGQDHLRRHTHPKSALMSQPHGSRDAHPGSATASSNRGRRASGRARPASAADGAGGEPAEAVQFPATPSCRAVFAAAAAAFPAAVRLCTEHILWATYFVAGETADNSAARLGDGDSDVVGWLESQGVAAAAVTAHLRRVLSREPNARLARTAITSSYEAAGPCRVREPKGRFTPLLRRVMVRLRVSSWGSQPSVTWRCSSTA